MKSLFLTLALGLISLSAAGLAPVPTTSKCCGATCCDMYPTCCTDCCPVNCCGDTCCDNCPSCCN